MSNNTSQALELKPRSSCEGEASSSTKPKPPRDAPVLGLNGIFVGGHILSFAECRRGHTLPKDAVRLELFTAVHDDREPAPIDKATYFRSFTHGPIRIDFDCSQDGRSATYYGRWANAKGEVGPWSGPVKMTIATH